MSLFRLQTKGARDFEVRSARSSVGDRAPILLFSCYSRVAGKFSRFTELSRAEVVELVGELVAWAEETEGVDDGG